MQALFNPHASRAKAWYQFHFCVLLWGCTAVLGKLISLPALPLVWWRLAIVTALLLLMPRCWAGFKSMPRRLFAIYLGIGVLVALHWLAFYASVKLANASVAASTLAIGPVFVAFIEPWIVKRRFNPAEVLLGIAVIPGVALVVGGTPEKMHAGIWMGMTAAVLVAIFASLNKRYAAQASSFSITCLEMGGGLLFITLLLPLLPHSETPFVVPSHRDAILLFVLCLACTLLPFVLSLVALRQLSAFGAQLALNLEPVYAIVLGIFLLGEQYELSGRFYFGVAIILAAIFIYPLLGHRADAKNSAK